VGVPEVHRSGHTDVDPDHAAEVAERRSLRPRDHGTAPVPPANRPGHHPDVEQDKPEVAQRFSFEFDPKLGLLSRVVGVHPGNARVQVTRTTLLVEFGRWSLETPVGNVVETQATGPYAWWKVAGPPRISLADRGITFATTAARGLCISFRDPVPAALPTSLLRHPSVTVTPSDVEGLAEALEAARSAQG
jgi:hypothetical protein